MKKKIFSVLVAIILGSCSSLPGDSSTQIYSSIPEDAKVHLRRIELAPPHILNGISTELPALVENCLSEAGFSISAEPGDDIYELDLFLHMKNWQYNYSSLESVTFIISLSNGGEIAAYRIYTEDTDKSVESFSWTFSLIDKNIKKTGFGNP